MTTNHPLAIRLDQVNLVTGDVAASVEFYRLLGVEIPDVQAPWDGRHRTAVMPESVEGETALDFDIDDRTFADEWGGADVPLGALIGFRVASREGVDALYERVTAAGHPGVRAPYDAFWGARYAIVLDPSGVAVGLMSPRDPDMQSAPPDSTQT